MSHSMVAYLQNRGDRANWKTSYRAAEKFGLPLRLPPEVLPTNEEIENGAAPVHLVQSRMFDLSDEEDRLACDEIFTEAMNGSKILLHSTETWAVKNGETVLLTYIRWSDVALELSPGARANMG